MAVDSICKIETAAFQDQHISPLGPVLTLLMHLLNLCEHVFSLYSSDFGPVPHLEAQTDLLAGPT